MSENALVAYFTDFSEPNFRWAVVVQQQRHAFLIVAAKYKIEELKHEDMHSMETPSVVPCHGSPITKAAVDSTLNNASAAMPQPVSFIVQALRIPALARSAAVLLEAMGETGSIGKGDVTKMLFAIEDDTKKKDGRVITDITTPDGEGDDRAFQPGRKRKLTQPLAYAAGSSNSVTNVIGTSLNASLGASLEGRFLVRADRYGNIDAEGVRVGVRASITKIETDSAADELVKKGQSQLRLNKVAKAAGETGGFGAVVRAYPGNLSTTLQQEEDRCGLPKVSIE